MIVATSKKPIPRSFEIKKGATTMKCLVCDNQIRIDTLKQLFNLDPPLLCSRCRTQLVKKSSRVLYEENDWVLDVIERLNRGVVALTRIFSRDLKVAIQKAGRVTAQIKVIETKENLPYPWLGILVREVASKERTQSDGPPLTICVHNKNDDINCLAIV